MTTKIRIARFLAECGVNSRRKCEALITEGRVKVNGITVNQLYFKVDSEKDRVEYNGKPLIIEKKIVLALNKPAGYLCTLKDNFSRKTILDLLKGLKDYRRLYPVGRLDYNSRGLLIMTNDGDLAYKILHPKFNIPKTYEVVLNSKLIKDDIEKLLIGVVIDGTKVDIGDIKLSQITKDQNKVMVTIHEGRKRIIRRVFKNLGYEVLDLKRIRIGDYDIGEISEGEFRILNEEDIDKILMIKNR